MRFGAGFARFMPLPLCAAKGASILVSAILSRVPACRVARRSLPASYR